MASTNFTDNSTVIAASWLDDVDVATYSALSSVAGTNTITATGPVPMSAYATGQLFRFIPANTNTGATTINITPSGGSALGAKNIFVNGAACAGGEIVANVPCLIYYDGTQFNIIGPFPTVPLYGGIGKNAIINGDFKVAQRGTSFTSATTPANSDDTYLLDRWTLLSDGNDIVDVSQESTTVPTNGLYAIALDVETANKKFGIIQFIEQKNCKGFIGKTCTLSFQARKGGSNATVGTMRAVILAWDGTADAVTSDIVSAWNASGTRPTLVANWTAENTDADLTLTTSFQKFSVSAAIDTASAKNIAVFLYYNNADGTVGDFIYITDIQLEVGSVATEFARLDIVGEQALCERYLPAYNSASASGAAIAMANAVTSTSAVAVYPFRVRPRTPPTGVTASSAAHFLVTDGTGVGVNATAIAFDTATPHGVSLTVTVAAGLTAGRAGIFGSQNASAQLLFTGCEL